MLSDRNIREINDQIERELRTVRSSLSSNADKDAAMSRIDRFNAILNPDKVSASVPELDEADDYTLADLTADIADMLRRRRNKDQK